MEIAAYSVNIYQKALAVYTQQGRANVHMYMSLQRAYDAAAQHDYDCAALSAVQQLLQLFSQIAQKISQRVIELYLTYRSYTALRA